jgi:hypothetical protein
MSEELFAISKVSPAPAPPSEYDSICAVMMDTERGRWFLQEYAERARSADTQLLLEAVQRIEAVVCAEPNKPAQPSSGTDLLEMPKTAARTQAEVAEIDTAAPPQAAGSDSAVSPLPQPPQPGDVFAAAKRIRYVTSALRGHGFDRSTCDQLEELAASILSAPLSASWLRDPSDQRTGKLREVLQYLEHRIGMLLESCMDGDASALEPASEPDHHAFEPVPAGKAAPENGFAGPFVIEERKLDAAASEAGRASPPSPPTDARSIPPAARDEAVEANAAAQSPPPAAEITLPEASLPPPPDPSVADRVEPPSIAGGAAAARAQPQGAHVPTVKLIHSSRLLPKSPGTRAASPALREVTARSFLSEIEQLFRSERSDMPGVKTARAGRASRSGSLSPEAVAATPRPRPAIGLVTDLRGEPSAAFGTAQSTGLAAAPPVPDQPPSPAGSQPAAAEDVRASQAEELTGAEPAQPLGAPLLAAAAPAPQPLCGDPFATLEAMSDHELIALFS